MMFNLFSKAKTTVEISASRLVLRSAHRILIVTGFSLFSLLFLLPVATLASESLAREQWKAFLTNPSANSYKPLSGTTRMCVVTKCHDTDVAGSEDNFSNLYRLLELTEHGNHYAMELAFQIRPLYENAAAPQRRH